jgi:hypothetical protein
MNLMTLWLCQFLETKYNVDVVFAATEYCDTKLEFCVYTVSQSWC